MQTPNICTLRSILVVDLTLGLLALLALGILLTVILHMYTGVPYVPTPSTVVKAMVDAAAIRKGETVMDPGAGDARLLIWAKKKYPTITAWGCEIVPPVWLLGWIRILLSGQKVRLRLGDGLRQDFSKADVIFLYMMPEVLRAMEPGLDRQLKKGSRVVSHAFKFKNRTPVRVVKVPGLLHDKCVYVYEW